MVGLSAALLACAPTPPLSPRAISLTDGQSVQFTAPFPEPVLTWSVDDVRGGGAPMGTITASGLYTAPRTIGEHTVQAASATRVARATVTTSGQMSVLTSHGDPGRTGQNLQEYALSPATVDVAHFGKLFSCPVDGWVYTQPLFVAGLTVRGQGVHNVVFVATQHDSVFAFDADAPGPPLWHVSFLADGTSTVPPADVDDTEDIVPEIGVTGTPVIDLATGTLYVVAATKEASGAIVQRLHALDVASGAERPGSPVEIQARVAGRAADGDGTSVAFSPLRHLQRPGLLLSQGTVWVAFGSHGDAPPYHGWVLGYDAATLRQVAAFNTTPDGAAGSIWQSGGGVAADAAGALYFETANGDFDADTGGSDLSSSVVKLDGTGALVDWFTPYNQAELSANDVDLGSGGPLLVPDLPGVGRHLLVASGKSGNLYLLDREGLGHQGDGDNDTIVQEVVVTPNTTDGNSGFFSTPAFWNGHLYVAAARDQLKDFVFLDSGLLTDGPSSQSTATLAYPGATPSVSAQGHTGGIVWLAEGAPATSPAVLRAYDAQDVAKLLYSSDQAPDGRDTAGLASKFMVPTIANGKVYVPTQVEVSVYGQLP